MENESGVDKIVNGYTRVLRWIIFAMAAGAGVGVLVMMLTTCADVILLRFKMPLKGAYDIVKITSALTLALALPYTTAVKGHVAIEYFFHKLGRWGRICVDIIMRLLGIGLFGFLAYRNFIYGSELQANGQVTQTLRMPVFWVPWVIGVCCLVTGLVIAYHLVHPNKEMIKP